MGLEASLNRIIQLRESIRKSEYFKSRCRERGFDPDEVVSYITHGNLVAMEEQGADKLKLTFERDVKYDSNIIIQIRAERIDFVTVFPSERGRREKS